MLKKERSPAKRAIPEEKGDGMALTEKTTLFEGKLSGAQLKWIAVLSMIADHVGSCLLRKWYVLSNYTIVASQNTGGRIALEWAIRLCDIFGSVAFPLFCFLLAEGFAHSRSPGAYAGRMAVFAVLSEIPFNLAHKMRIFYPALQNVMFTLTVSILTLWAASVTDEKYRGTKWQLPVRCGVVLLGMGLAFLIRGEYVFLGVLAAALFYYLREYRYLRLAAFLPLAIPSLWSLLAVPAVLAYNGKRGRQSKAFFYVFYPAHFLILYAVMALSLKLTPDFFL